MEKRDLEAEETAPRAIVDQLGARGREPFELRSDVVHLERNVVHARPSLGEKPADGSVGPESREQLHSAPAHLQRGRLDALLSDRLTVFELGAEQAAVGLDGFVEVVDRHSEMVNVPNRHAAMLAAPRTPRRPARNEQPVPPLRPFVAVLARQSS